jgi:hypothetical protein
MEEASFINTKSLQMISGAPHKFEAEDTVLNNFDFSARSQQKEGYTDDTLILRQGLSVVVVAKDGVETKYGVVVGFKPIPEQEIEGLVKEEGQGIPIMEECIRAWIKKYPQVPFVKLESSGEVVCVKVQLWKIISNGRVTSWRLHLPLRIASAIAVTQSQCMRFDKLMVL